MNFIAVSQGKRRSALLCFALLLLWNVSGPASPPPPGLAPVLVPAGGFSIDGETLANMPTPGAGDWMLSTNWPGAGGAVLSPTGLPLNPTMTFHVTDPYSSSSDQTFAGGLKWIDDPNTWKWTTGKPSSKTDINNGLVHIAADADGHIWVIVAADRFSTSGDSYIDFEFLQNTLTKNSNGTFTSAGLQGGRTTGDLVLSLAFTSGGSVGDFFALRWQTNGSGGYTYVDCTTKFPVGRVFAALNSNTIAAPYGAFGKTTYAANAFAEAAVDLSALLGNFDQCLSIGFKTIMIKTKASASDTASIEDFIDPIQYSLKIGPSAEAGPDQTRCYEGDSTAFALHGVATAGLRAIASTGWSVLSGTAIIDSPDLLTTTAHVFSATATLRLTAIQTDGCVETSDIILTVAPLPVCSIAGPSLVCPGSSNVFRGPAGMSGYAWSLTGNGAISGPTNTQSVTVIAGKSCAQNFTLALTVTSNQCVSACTTDVMVNDTTPPTLTCPPDRLLECPADTRTNATGMAIAQDACGAVTISYSDVTNNNCGGSKVITRTWTAADQCDNSASCVQTITVRDTLKPSITCPPDRVLECPADLSPNATGVAIAQDACSAVTIGYSDVTNNNCGGTKVIARTWTATDDCGNSAACLQTITVRDTLKPTITCPPDQVLECPADTSTNATGMATAQDACSAVTIRYSDSITTNCGGSKVISRTWTATDGCSNSVSCVQLLTVRDTLKPSLTCPPDRLLECPADTGTNACGVATAQDACSAVTIRYSDGTTNNCAGTKVIARTWTATDACNNSNSCVQTITVRDTLKPTITCPADVVLECPADTRTNVTGVATAQDGCSAVSITYSDVVSTNCGPTRLLTRTWTATDQCGNSASCAQTITVRDTLKPTITCPPDRLLECPADTRTNATGVASAQDTCSPVTIRYSDVTNNNCAGTKVIARTWTAADQCGNSASCVQTITVQDTLKPIITCPPDRILECPADLSTNATGVATAQDACSAVTIRYTDVTNNNCAGTKVIARTWTATDDCGNSASCLQTITVRDTLKPTITCPPNQILECPADTSTNACGVATAQDACSAVTIQYSDSITTNCGGSKVIARTWTATDGCSNSVSCVQALTVRDTLKPSLACPPDRLLECPADTSTNACGVATAQDTCSAVTIRYSDVTTNNCAGSKVIARTWTATDACSNSVSCLQTITVRDTLKPIITCPPNVTLECPITDTGTNLTGVATAQDGCSAVTITYSDAVSTNCGATRVLTRTWTATDQCGNSASCAQTITVRDTVKPTITCPPDRVLECPADTSTNACGVAVGQDACSAVTIRYSDVVTTPCGGAKIIARAWSATDACGNSISCTQTITVRDTLKPALTCPPDLLLECPADLRTNATGVASAQDGCGAVTLTYSDSISNNCGGTKIVSRLWTATDGCGNSTNGVQTITVRDTTPPSLKLPGNLVLQCPGDTRTNVTGVPTAVDGCGSVTVSYSDVVSNGCGLTRTVSRLWTAIDQCGNSTNGLQTITVVDTTKPSVTCPTLSVQCVGDVPAPYADLAAFLAAGGKATDSCSSALTFSLTSDSGLVGSCPGKVTRVYRATDACGNFGECTQTITVDDTIPPVLNCPGSLTAECGVSFDPATFGGATATDNCSTNVLLTHSDVVVQTEYNLSFLVADPDSGTGPYSPTYLKFAPGSLPCPDAARLTGRALDPLRNAVAYAPSGQLDALTSIGNVPMAYGQIVPFEVVIQVSGGAGPERGTLEFTADWSTYTTSNNRFGYDTNYMVYCAFVDAADPGSIDPNINARVESYSSVVVDPGAISERIRGKFRVSGLDSGDRVIVEIWVVLMSTMPEHTGGTVAAGLVSAQKASDPPVPITVGIQTDSLGNLSKIGVLPPPQQQPPLGPLPPQPPVLPGATVSVFDRTWTATDDCGNHSTCVQRITVRDTTPPALSTPADLVLPCLADTSTTATGVATAPDNCGSVLVTYSDSVSNICDGNKVIARTWTASDQFGNSTNAVQTITVRDQPILTCPPDQLLECPADTSTNATGVASAQDTCSAVTITYRDVTSNTCGGSKMITRTWTAADQCGNSASCAQTITVQDALTPIINCPPDRLLECPADLSTNANGMATAQDACSAVTIRYNDVTNNNCGGAKVIARTWTATDDCGNNASCVQTITVRDTLKPTITCPPDRVLECPTDSSTNATGVATAQDACSAVTIRYSDSITTNCGGSKVIARTWTATDACNNSISCLQTITVRDTLKPTITCPPNVVLECPITNTGTNVTGVATAQDGCSAVTITYSDAVSTNCGATRVVTRTWTATDQCGNSATCAQTITVRDTVKPTIACPPDRLLECPADISTNACGVATAQDTCSAVTIRYSDVTTNNCAGSKVIARTWTATDACNNSNSCVQTITVRDTLKPTITCPPNVLLECPITNTGTNVTGVATAQDGCSAVTITYSDTVSTNCGATRVVTRTWTATDQCGNSASCAQTITVRDTIKPTITCPPDRLLECPADTSTNACGVATAQDTCSAVTIRYSDVTTNNCAGTKVIARTWTATDACNNSNSCVQTITVRDTLKPTITCPPNVLLECPITNTGTNVTGVATAQDGCSAVTITYSDTVSTNCGATRVVTRTWTATDQCGNSASCAQTITVRDTVKPTIACPPDRLLECPADTSTNACGVATAQDTCSAVTIRYSDVTTIICGGAKVIARTWTATDACGNSASCVQTVTLRDTTPPSIVCPPSRTVVAGDTWNFDAPLASDTCSSVSVLTLSTVTNASVATRTWAAVDACGNSNTCQQSITISSAPAPLLQVSCMQDGAVKLSWPSSLIGYQLEACDRFTSTNWATVSLTPVSINGTNSVQFMPTLNRNFYRLRKP